MNLPLPPAPSWPAPAQPGPAQPEPRRGWVRILVNLAVAVVVIAVAGAGFVFSYSGVHAVALLGGVSTQLAKYYPAVFDALLVIACVAAVVLRDGRWWARLWAWFVIIIVLAAIGWVDVIHAMNYGLQHRPTQGAVAAAPVVAVLLAFSLLLSMLRQSKPRSAGLPGPSSGRNGRRARRDADDGPETEALPTILMPAVTAPTVSPPMVPAPVPVTPAPMGPPAAEMAQPAAELAPPAAEVAPTRVDPVISAVPETRAEPVMARPDALPAALPSDDAAAEHVTAADEAAADEAAAPTAPEAPEASAAPEEPAAPAEPPTARTRSIRYAGRAAREKAGTPDYWDTEDDPELAGQVYPVRHDADEPDASGEPADADAEADQEPDAEATARFATIPRLNRARVTPTPPADDDD